MKTIYQIIGLLCLILTSCSSQEDEPDMSYKGPWRIMFDERVAYIHNDSEDLNKWINKYAIKLWDAQYYVIGEDSSKDKIISGSNTQVIKHYSERFYGYIIWYMDIPTLAEDDLKSMVAEFESFTIMESETKFDKFTASYWPVTETP